MAQKPKFNSITQTIYDEGQPESQRVTSYGKTSGGVKVPILVDATGIVQTAGGAANTYQNVIQPSAASLNATVTFAAGATIIVSSLPSITTSVNGQSLTAYQGGAWTVNVNGGSLGASQIGTWTVQPGNTPNTTQWLVNASNSSLFAIQSGTWNVGANGGSLSALLLAGTAEIGNVKNSGTFAVQSTNQASTNLIGEVYTLPDVLNLGASLSVVAPKFAVINIATAGDNAIVAATTSKKTLVLDYVLVVGANGDGLTWKDGIGGTAVSGQMRFAANGGISAGYSPVGHFQTASGGTLTLNSSLGSQVSGHLTYVVV